MHNKGFLPCSYQHSVDDSFLSWPVGDLRRAQICLDDRSFCDDIPPGIVLICRVSLDGLDVTFLGCVICWIGHVRYIAPEEAYLLVSAKGAYLLAAHRCEVCVSRFAPYLELSFSTRSNDPSAAFLAF